MFSHAANALMRFVQVYRTSGQLERKTVLMVLEPSLYDLPLLRKRVEGNKNNNKNNKNNNENNRTATASLSRPNNKE